MASQARPADRRAAAAAGLDAARARLGHAASLEGGRRARRRAVPVVDTPGQASYLAADLANLMDVDRKRGGRSRRARQPSCPRNSPAIGSSPSSSSRSSPSIGRTISRDNGLVSPVARRNGLMAVEAERLARGAPHPVIAAGSTGTVPATARLLEGHRLAAERRRGAAGPRSLARRGELGEPRPSIPSTRKPAWPSCCASSACAATRSPTCRGASRRAIRARALRS